MADATQPVTLTSFGTEDGDPWAVFADGHIDPSLVSLDAINASLDRGGFEPVSAADIKHHWIYEDADEAGEDGMFPWQWGNADTFGAVPITGVRFE